MKGGNYMLNLMYDYEWKRVWERFSKTVNYSFALILGLILFSFLFSMNDAVRSEMLTTKLILGGQNLLVLLFSVFLFIGSSELSNSLFNPDNYSPGSYNGSAIKILPYLLLILGGNLLYSFMYALVTFSEIIAFFIIIILWLEMKTKTGEIIDGKEMNINLLCVS